MIPWHRLRSLWSDSSGSTDRCLAARYTSTAAAEMLGDAFYEATKLICCYFEVRAPWGPCAMLDRDVLWQQSLCATHRLLLNSAVRARF